MKRRKGSASLVRSCIPFIIHHSSFIISTVTTLGFAVSAQPNLLFFAVPPTEMFQDSLARFVAMAKAPGAKLTDSCALYRSPTPAGDRFAGHPARIAAEAKLGSDSSSITFAFKPMDKDAATGAALLPLGVHFLVAACRDGKDVTPEFPLRVVTRQAPTFLTPKSLETSPSPNISWTAVPGVPAYHVLLSDQPIKIDPEKGSVDGASIIWQAITNQTSIAYGTPDPSGVFAGIPAPPLSQGVTYNLVLLNNYDGRSSLATSAKAQSLKLFSLQTTSASLSKPVNKSPKAGATLSSATDASLTLRWTSAKTAAGKAANTYKAFIYSREEQNGAEVLIPIWQSEVTDTFAVLDAKQTLLDKAYIMKVFAVSDAGTGVVGDTTSFTYHNAVQTLSLVTRTTGAAGDTVYLGDVRIEAAPLDGSADPLPLFTLEDGRISKELAVGGYALTFSKAGYAVQKSTVTLGTGPVTVDQFLPVSPARVTGRAVDAAGLGLDNVTIKGTGAGGKTFTATSDARGYFLLGSAQGSLAVNFSRPDYASRDTVLVLKAGQSVEIGTVKLTLAQAALGGTVVNDQGIPLSGCRIDVKTPAGLAVRTLLSDDRGAFSAFFAAGTYTVAASRLGFTSAEKTVQLSDAVRIDFTLASGASVLKGRVTAKADLGAGATQSAPLAGAILELKDSRGTVRKSQSDLRGDYSFSVDTGQYRLKIGAPGKVLPDSVIVKIAEPRSTVTRDLELAALAAIQGVLQLTPDSAVDPASATVSLLKLPSRALVASVAPSRAGGALAFSLEGVPDGEYRLTCGLPGYGPLSEPEVTVAGGAWVTGVVIPLKRANKSLTFALSRAGAPVTGTIRLLTPEARDLASGEKLAPAPSGSYTLDAVPDSLEILPLAGHPFYLPAGGSADTTATLPLAFAHFPAPLKLSKGAADLVLKTPAPIDEAAVVFGYGDPTDTLKLTPAQVAAAGDSVVFHIAPEARGGPLTYYFTVTSGAYFYSNEAPDRRFHAEVAPSPDLASLGVSMGDTLRLPAASRCEILVHAFDAAGNRLDSLVDLRGKVAFSAGSGLPVRLKGKAARRLIVATGGAQPALAKGSAAAAWDDLTVTVTLDSLQKTLKLPARVVAARINRLVLTSTLGEAAEVPAPRPFGLFVAGFDTNATPPVPLVPEPEFELDPPEAGVIENQQVRPAPNFIGPLRVIARHVNADGSMAATELGAGRDSLLRGLNVGQTLGYGDSARLFVHDPQFELRAPDSLLAAEGQTVLRVYRRSLAKSFTSGVTDVVAGRVYEISNASGAPFARAPSIRLGVPPAYQGRLSAIKRFDLARLDWKDLPDSAGSHADTNAFGKASLSDTLGPLDGNYYALLSRSKPLSAGALEIIPNPFSPLVLASRDGNTQYGTRIRLRPESDQSSEVTVSIRVYNLDGELVRLLIDHKTIPKSTQDFYWDGKTDSGRWARNGRYIVKVSLTATGTHSIKQVIKPVVVFQ